MSLITILIVLLIVGGISYLIKIAPIDQIWKTLAYVAIAIFFLVWLLRQLRASGVDMTI